MYPRDTPHTPTAEEWLEFWSDTECTPGNRREAAESPAASGTWNPASAPREARISPHTRPRADRGHRLRVKCVFDVPAPHGRIQDWSVACSCGEPLRSEWTHDQACSAALEHWRAATALDDSAAQPLTPLELAVLDDPLHRAHETTSRRNA